MSVSATPTRRGVSAKLGTPRKGSAATAPSTPFKVPATPKAKSSGTPKATPRATPGKRTILNYDANESYIEENDESYAYNDTTAFSDDDEEDNDDDDELNEFSDEDFGVDSDVEVKVNEITQSPDSSTSEISLLPESASAFRQFLVKHEVPRKVLHSSIGIVTLYLYTIGVHQTQLIIPLTSLFAIIFTNDYIRLHNPALNKRIVKAWWFLVRESEFNSYNGTLWYLAGLAIVFSIFPKDISLMSVLLLSWADTAASTFGRLYGKYTPKVGHGKSLAGCFASFFAGLFSSYLLYGYFIPVYSSKVNVAGDVLWTAETSRLNLHVLSLISGVVASVSELVSLYGLDDNFTIPVLSAFALYGLAKVSQV